MVTDTFREGGRSDSPGSRCTAQHHFQTLRFGSLNREILAMKLDYTVAIETTTITIMITIMTVMVVVVVVVEAGGLA